MTKVMKRRLVAGLLLASTIVVHAAPSATAARTVDLTPGAAVEQAAACSVPQVSGPVHRCAPQAWSSGPGWLGIEGIAGAGEPRPYPLRATSTIGTVASHKVNRSVSRVTYRWVFAPEGDTYAKKTATSPAHAAPTVYTALALGAVHSACPKCTASSRIVISGADPNTGQSGPESYVWDPARRFEVSVTVTNASGGPVPAGDVTLKATLSGMTDLVGTPLWQGWGSYRTHLRTVQVTAMSA